jgi:hypothetical protein
MVSSENLRVFIEENTTSIEKKIEKNKEILTNDFMFLRI